ncbi:hypothetical protein Hanom_Chr13g01237471 [Helianthus anomalus]
MRHSSNQVPDDDGGCSNLGYNNRKVRFQTSPFTTASSFPPLLPDKRSYWKRVSFGRFSSQPIGLSVLKLDGSTFGNLI